jgi:hypothetical protein
MLAASSLFFGLTVSIFFANSTTFGSGLFQENIMLSKPKFS